MFSYTINGLVSFNSDHRPDLLFFCLTSCENFSDLGAVIPLYCAISPVCFDLKERTIKYVIEIRRK